MSLVVVQLDMPRLVDLHGRCSLFRAVGMEGQKRGEDESKGLTRRRGGMGSYDQDVK